MTENLMGFLQNPLTAKSNNCKANMIYNTIKIVVQFLKEFGTAYYRDGKIYNCTANGIIWYHEKRHMIQFENEKVAYIYGKTLTTIPLILIAIREYRLIFYYLALIYVLILISYEVDAWLYAVRMRMHDVNTRNEYR